MRLVIASIGIGIAALAAQGAAAKSGSGTTEPPAMAVGKSAILASGNQPEGTEKHRREREERLEKLRKTYSKQLSKCQGGDHYACDAALVTEGEIHDIAATVPARPN